MGRRIIRLNEQNYVVKLNLKQSVEHAHPKNSHRYWIKNKCVEIIRIKKHQSAASALNIKTLYLSKSSKSNKFKLVYLFTINFNWVV